MIKFHNINIGYTDSDDDVPLSQLGNQLIVNNILPKLSNSMAELQKQLKS